MTAIAITGTRALTLRLRERGAMRAAISTTAADPAELAERVRQSPPMAGADLAREVSTAGPYVVAPPPGIPVRYRVAAVDLGIKAATPAALAALGCEVRVLPAASTAEQILAGGPDGVFFSNGPGDPAACGYAVEAMRGVLAAGTPVFGICLGSQILGQALGLGTYKLQVRAPRREPAGPGPAHRPGPDHQPQPWLRGRDAGRRPDGGGLRGVVPGQPGRPGAVSFGTEFGPAEVTHVNLNDGVVEGLRLLDAPAFAVQYHPEAAPGPHDASPLFGEFCSLMERGR